jgi:alginate O-acetyltransferase complex protein AlgI
VWLKRYTFVPRGALLPFHYVTLGLSYIFFRVMHMIVDAKDETLPVPVGITSYLNYTLNFTTIVSGPIQLYPDFASSQLNPEQRSLTLQECAWGLERVVIGFFKLRVLSAIFSAVQHAAHSQLSANQPLEAKLVTACVMLGSYPLYLYCNFSGFIDVMIGLGAIFHLDLPENFNRPFSASSFIEFWNRWHVTLSNWLKAYVYIPLVKSLMRRFPGSQIEPFIGVFAFFVTFFIIGAWHGPTSEFLFYGLLLGGGVALNKLFQVTMSKALGRKRYRVLDGNPIYTAFSRGLTFTYFIFSLIWFWSNWADIHRLAGTLTIGQTIVVWLALWLGSTASLAAWEMLREGALRISWEGATVLLSPSVRVAWVCYIAILSMLALSVASVATPVLYQIF